MGGKAEERLHWKEPLHSLEVELQREFGLSPVGSRALIRRIGEFLEDYAGAEPGSRSPGQVSYPAVAVGERAGKALRYCLTVPVALTVLHSVDAQILHNDGSPALRRVRLSRLCAEAYRQGAVLSHEDLSLLLGVELSTVGRLVQGCVLEGERPPTRGLVEDIGPVLSHKEQVLKLYFRGLLPARIAARTGHTLGSVERYLADFARVVELRRQDLSPEATIRITGMSPSLVRRYLHLLEQFDGPEHAFVLKRLLREAFEQGATLTSCQLAIMTGISQTQVNKQLRHHCEQTGEVLPLRGIVEDCSPAISHKAMIVARHLEGESTAEIARSTNHTPHSVERYIQRFEQVRELVRYARQVPEPAIIARILRCSERLVRAYLELSPASEISSRKDAIREGSSSR